MSNKLRRIKNTKRKDTFKHTQMSSKTTLNNFIRKLRSVYSNNKDLRNITRRTRGLFHFFKRKKHEFQPYAFRDLRVRRINTIKYKRLFRRLRKKRFTNKLLKRRKKKKKKYKHIRKRRLRRKGKRKKKLRKKRRIRY